MIAVLFPVGPGSCFNTRAFVSLAPSGRDVRGCGASRSPAHLSCPDFAVFLFDDRGKERGLQTLKLSHPGSWRFQTFPGPAAGQAFPPPDSKGHTLPGSLSLTRG